MESPAHRTVSVLIATRNRRDVLAESLRAYQRQSYPDIEILVADNGSSDGTVEMLARDFPHVSVVAYPENRGPLALNDLAERATGAYLWRTDDDASPADPTTLADAVQLMEQYPHVTAVTGDILERLIGYQPLDYYPFERPEHIPDEGLPAIECWGTCMMVRREAFLAVGGFWNLFYGEELDLSSRLILNGGELRYQPRLRVRHESAFASKRASERQDVRKYVDRWLLQTESSVRYQWRYFPWWMAFGRTKVIWFGLLISAVSHRFGVRQIWQGLRVTMRAIAWGRAHHLKVTSEQRSRITMDRSIWDVVFRYYKVRWQQRRTSVA
jgi:GT2 family glycosyltransferase